MNLLLNQLLEYSKKYTFPLSLTRILNFKKKEIDKALNNVTKNLYLTNGVPEIINLAFSGILENYEFYVASNNKKIVIESTSDVQFLVYDTGDKTIQLSLIAIDAISFYGLLELLILLKMQLSEEFFANMMAILKYKDMPDEKKGELNCQYYALVVDELFSFIEEIEDKNIFVLSSSQNAPLGFKQYVFKEITPTLKAKFGIVSGLVVSPINKDIFSNFVVEDEITNKNSTSKSPTTDKEWEKQSWNIHPSRIFAEKEEEMMMETEMRLKDYQLFSNAKTAVESFFFSSSLTEPISSAMFYGPSGTGKTELVQYMASKLHLPVVTFQCSANTEEIDLVGKAKSLGITENSSGCIEYTTTPLVQAVENGWIIEIQEVASIKESAVIQLFNSLLDGTRKLLLSDGRQISVHPDFKIVFTTNVVYEGCQNLNQSFISRCQFVMFLDAPSKDESVERLIQKTGYSGSKEDIEDVVSCVNNISNFLNDSAIDDGACDFRSCCDWVRQKMATNWSWSKCAEFTVIPKATLITEYHSSIRDIINAKFENR